ncbi:MAG: hypothetical protein OSB39_11690 [Opitutales bacterium]|nr:hypothetical protein [Opitutales bacterium]
MTLLLCSQGLPHSELWAFAPLYGYRLLSLRSFSATRSMPCGTRSNRSVTFRPMANFHASTRGDLVSKTPKGSVNLTPLPASVISNLSGLSR